MTAALPHRTPTPGNDDGSDRHFLGPYYDAKCIASPELTYEVSVMKTRFMREMSEAGRDHVIGLGSHLLRPASASA